MLCTLNEPIMCSVPLRNTYTRLTMPESTGCPERIKAQLVTWLVGYLVGSTDFKYITILLYYHTSIL